MIQNINHPIIVGIGQITHHEKITYKNDSALDLAKKAVNACLLDMEKTDILSHIDSISLVNSYSCHLDKQVEILCDDIGIRPGIREETYIGGNNPQWLVNKAADQIAAGKIKAALLVGTETNFLHDHAKPVDFFRTFRRLKDDVQVVGDRRDAFTEHEILHKILAAKHIYPLFENALRYHLKMSLTDQKAMLDIYYKKMAQAASGNPLAWTQNEKIADITTVSKNNRMIAFPYTKMMNPNPFVNQAAAVILTDTCTAKRLSIPEEKWVYPHGGAEATDKWFVSDRIHYHFSPAIEELAAASMQMAGIELSDIDFFDIYSCFPCAVHIAAQSLGLSLGNLPELSITGGLRYFGGPGNNYTMHAIAHTVERLRADKNQYGLVTGMGWYMTKHAIGIYSGLPPEKLWKRLPSKAIQHKIDTMESPVLCEQPSGEAIVETYTIVYEDEEVFPVIIARLTSGERCLATTDPKLAKSMEQEEFIGKKGKVSPGTNAPNMIRFD